MTKPMTAHEVVSRLETDQPLLHYYDDDWVADAAQAGITIPKGEQSLAVAPAVLRWIADRLTGDMTTIETGAGHTTVLFAAIARHHYCLTYKPREADKIREYLARLGLSDERVTFVFGPTDETLPGLNVGGQVIDFAYIDGCHGYPYPAMDWHHIDKRLKVGGLLGMDNVELRPVREHCEFLEENGTYELVESVYTGYFVRFYRKREDQWREWVCQPYSRAKKDPCDWGLVTRIRRKASPILKRFLW